MKRFGFIAAMVGLVALGLVLSPSGAFAQKLSGSHQWGDSGLCNGIIGPGHCDDFPEEGDPPPNGCTCTQGYWKNHVNQWPLEEITLGSETYSVSEALEILNTDCGTKKIYAGVINVQIPADGGDQVPAFCIAYHDEIYGPAGEQHR